MYQTDDRQLIDEGTGGARDLHLGVDLWAPTATEVRAFADGEIFLTGYCPGAGDYGFVVVTLHWLPSDDPRARGGLVPVWALHGHLAAKSIYGKRAGQRVLAGEPIGWMGANDPAVNGGWGPHVHMQLSLVEPIISDWPGVVESRHREPAMQIYIDPRRVLGPLF
jgi:murein DD-endopeptidase MepM/ murein hydrolase activator NlpD